jgi:gamma-glutamyltranspeptidase/glutathione hydrolase
MKRRNNRPRNKCGVTNLSTTYQHCHPALVAGSRIIILIVFLFLSVSSPAHSKSLSDIWSSEPASNFRKLEVVSGEKYMISTANDLASKAGAEILAQGGNAIDAAITAQMVLNLVEPQSSGIGGGGFLLYFDAKTGKTNYFNGRETAPAKAFPEMFLNADGTPKKFEDTAKGGLSVATPGLLKILKLAHKKHGKIAWEKLFEPAIKIAENGFAVNDRLHANANFITYIKNFSETAKLYTKADGSAREIGEIIKNPQMAETLRTIAKQGIKPFYEGKIANDIVEAVKNSPINPGFLSLSDLKNYQPKKGELICNSYRIKYRVCSMPLPSSGGVTLLAILGILENFNLSKLKADSAETVHLISEATRLAYADRNEYVGDVANVPLKKMLDKNYLKSRSKLIDLKKAAAEFEAGKFANYNSTYDIAASYQSAEPLSTTHLSIVDSEGNAVSFTSSIEYYFGSAISVDGFLLNNQMTDFSLLPEINGKAVANRIEPLKQPRSSMSPTFVFDQNNKLIMIVGSPGGPRIIQFVAKTIINHLDFGFDIQQAISAPNYAVLNDVVELEKGTKITNLEKSLRKMGHQTKITEITSGIHAIVIENGKITGGADPRRSGLAIGN